MSVHWYLAHVFVKTPRRALREDGAFETGTGRGRMVLLFLADDGSKPAKKHFYDSRPSTPTLKISTPLDYICTIQPSSAYI